MGEDRVTLVFFSALTCIVIAVTAPRKARAVPDANLTAVWVPDVFLSTSSHST
jgi:hypothetical protein